MTDPLEGEPGTEDDVIDKVRRLNYSLDQGGTFVQHGKVNGKTRNELLNCESTLNPEY